MRHVRRQATATRWRFAAGTASVILLAGTVLGAGTLPAGASAAPDSTTQDAVLPAPHNPAMDAVAAMQPSFNVGNTMDAIPDETSWGQPLITKQLFDTLKAQGFRSVRIPVTWSGHQSATAPYTIDPKWMSRVKQVVDWAVEDGLYVDLNVHHDSWQWIENMATDHDNVVARFKATWSQIATTFKDEPRKLLFEGVNEPQFKNATPAQSSKLLDELQTEFFDVVRHSGGGNDTRLLVLFPINNDQDGMDALAAEIASLHDSNLVATVHNYGFWPFTVNIAGYDTFDARVQQDMLDLYSRIYNTFVAKGVPVYMGEYGTFKYPIWWNNYNAIEPGEGKKFFEMFAYEARIHHVTTALWDVGNFINRSTFQPRDPALWALIRSSWKTRSGTASSDQLFIPKSGPITAQTISLNLNGTTFRGLSAGDWNLVKDTDYTINGDQLTLTAATVARLVGNQAYGVDSTLTVRFSKGVPWTINVITYGPVTQANATGDTTKGLVIPTRFNGDILAEMEATYADGSGAGPASWTTYQEYGYSFVPDAAGNTITMTPDFLKAINDGVPVTLTFYYWSGAKTTYTVTKSGTTVTGSTA
ncbi:Aryl-phospho-beta-D-glucosidase BglC, GH1 family [Streptomyces sp. Ag109_G2-15]|nr:Aryl-phospho-beta-D-glucosidase BglC, GH1 family [Streptomyces sp. Ag109_G2-15]